MPLGSDPLDELAIPDGTTVEEHDLVTDGDVIVGGQSTVEFGVRGHNVIAGERVKFGGHIEAEADCRLDMWSDVRDNVLVGRDAYLGERVHIGGRLMVSGDLDIGDDVNIEEGFEANGWIVIRNPMPTIVFVFVYLQQLLRIGEEEAAEEVVSDLLENEEIDADPVVVPRNGHVSDDSWRVSTPATIGDDCRLHGNFRAESIEVGERNDVFGSLRARGDISVGPSTVIHGDVTTRNGTVELADDVEVRGDVSCEDLHFHEGAIVDGTMRASGEMSMVKAGTHEKIAADGDGGRHSRGTPSASASSTSSASSDRPSRGNRKRFHGDDPGDGGVAESEGEKDSETESESETGTAIGSDSADAESTDAENGEEVDSVERSGGAEDEKSANVEGSDDTEIADESDTTDDPGGADAGDSDDSTAAEPDSDDREIADDEWPDDGVTVDDETANDETANDETANDETANDATADDE